MSSEPEIEVQEEEGTIKPKLIATLALPRQRLQLLARTVNSLAIARRSDIAENPQAPRELRKRGSSWEGSCGKKVANYVAPVLTKANQSSED